MSVQMINGVSRVGVQAQVEGTIESAEELLSAPDAALAAGADDVLVALAIAMVKQKKDDRITGDRQMRASAKAQEAAHARKIEKMHALADDTLMEGIVSGALEGASAIASGLSAVTKFDGDLKGLKAETAPIGDRKDELAMGSKLLARNAGLLDATSKGFDAVSRFGGSLCKSAQERDRADMAEADASKDAAKASLDAAASTISRANEDIRATISALRQLVAAKTQLANAAILRG